MNVNALPFDADAMVLGLRPWTECESPTYDTSSVNRMTNLAAAELAAMGAAIERIPGRYGPGDSVRAKFQHPDSDKPGILIAGHLDTVQSISTLKNSPYRLDGEKCWGPGIQDIV